MSVGPVPASAATACGMMSTENVGAERQAAAPVGSAPTTISGPNENNAAMSQASAPEGSPEDAATDNSTY